MREIKFRAFNVENKEMLEVENLYFNEMTNEVEIRTTMYSDYFNDAEMMLMQYTGLNDKNGKEIYERDIVKDLTETSLANTYIVIYSWAAFRLIPTYDYKQYLEYEKQNSMYANSNYRNTTRKFARSTEKFEVIGNIYENPELLEK